MNVLAPELRSAHYRDYVFANVLKTVLIRLALIKASEKVLKTIKCVCFGGVLRLPPGSALMLARIK